MKHAEHAPPRHDERRKTPKLIRLGVGLYMRLTRKQVDRSLDKVFRTKSAPRFRFDPWVR